MEFAAHVDRAPWAVEEEARGRGEERVSRENELLRADVRVAVRHCILLCRLVVRDNATVVVLIILLVVVVADLSAGAFVGNGALARTARFTRRVCAGRYNVLVIAVVVRRRRGLRLSSVMPTASSSGCSDVE